MDLREIAELLASVDVPQNQGASPAANRVSQAMMDNAFRLASPAPNMLAAMNNPAPQQNVLTTADIAKELADTVVDRGTFVPLVEYANGGFGLGLPGVLHAPIDAAKRMLTPGYDYDNIAQASRDALDASGLAFTGGLAAAAVRPGNTLGIFGGRLAKTADLDALARAEKLAAEGASRDDIWQQTGWFKGADGQWRFEIDDSGMKFAVPPREWIAPKQDGAPLMAPNLGTAYNKAAANLTPQAPVRAKRLFDHPELAAAYDQGFSGSRDHPGIMGMPVQLMEGGRSSGALIDGKTIGLHETLPPSDAKSTLLHELQHAVQEREGFARGGSPKDFTYQSSPDFHHRRSYESPEDTYRRLAGEVEARNVQTRRDMTPDERRAKAPWLTQDIPDDQQIFRRK